MLWCLYDDNMADCITLSEGCCTKISEAFIITLVLGYLDTSAIVACILSLDCVVVFGEI